MLKNVCRAAALVAVAGLTGLAGATTASADTPVKFTLDWKFEGPAAGFLLALDKGYFKAEGLDVSIDSGNGSVESISRVATGTYDMGFGDINSLVKLLDTDPSQKVKAVYMVYDRPTFAIVGRKSLGITSDPKSLEGKKLGAPPPDGAFAQWKAFKTVAGLDDGKITIENVGFPVREPMLAQGKVDAVFGFSFSVILNLKAQGVPADDIVPLLMGEHGLNLYGNAVMTNTDFAAKNPEAVKGVLKALAKGFRRRRRRSEGRRRGGPEAQRDAQPRHRARAPHHGQRPEHQDALRRRARHGRRRSGAPRRLDRDAEDLDGPHRHRPRPTRCSTRATCRRPTPACCRKPSRSRPFRPAPSPDRRAPCSTSSPSSTSTCATAAPAARSPSRI